jgi:hypothetical protein
MIQNGSNHLSFHMLMESLSWCYVLSKDSLDPSPVDSISALKHATKGDSLGERWNKQPGSCFIRRWGENQGRPAQRRCDLRRFLGRDRLGVRDLPIQEARVKGRLTKAGNDMTSLEG